MFQTYYRNELVPKCSYLQMSDSAKEKTRFNFLYCDFITGFLVKHLLYKVLVEYELA